MRAYIVAIWHVGFHTVVYQNRQDFVDLRLEEALGRGE